MTFKTEILQKIKFGNAIPTNDSLTCPEMEQKKLTKRELKAYRKRMIQARKYLEEGKNPLDFFLSNSDQDKTEGRTPNKEKFFLYTGIASRWYALTLRANIPSERLKRAEEMVEKYDALAAPYWTESFSD